MSNILLYLLKVLMSSGILFTYYWFFLRNKQFHHYNRFYLLFITFFSWIVPIIEIKIAKANELVVATLPKLVYIVADSNSTLEQEMLQKSKWLNWNNAIISIALIITVVFIERFLVSLFRVYKLIKRFPIQQIFGLKVILSEKEGTPFSFFDYIFWNTSIDLQSDSGKKILAHEVVHAEEYHSLDKLIIEFNLIIGWFNPFFWLIRNELYLIHEFIADSKSIKNNDAAALAELLLTAAYPQQHKLFLNQFFFSPIKRRIAMLTNQQKIKFSYFRKISVLPIVGFIVILFAFKNVDKHIGNAPVGFNQKFTIVIDAGHGGTDDGAAGVNGITEKGLSLTLSKKIASIKSIPNLNLIMTRENDEQISVVERVDKINALHPDLLISLHMNVSEKKDEHGVEFVVSNKSSQKEKSKKLAALLDWSVKDVFGNSHGITSRKSGIWILDQTNCPAVIAQLGFISNVKDVELYKQEMDILANKIIGAASLYLKNQDNINAENDTIIKKDTKDKANVNNNEVVTINLSSNANSNLNEKPIYILDGVIIDTVQFKKVDVNKIESVNVLKGKNAIDKYGDKGKHGVIEIKTKQQPSKGSIYNVSPTNGGLTIITDDVTFVAPVIQKNTTPSSTNEPVFNTTQVEPQFPGGANAWLAYLDKNLDKDVAKKNKAVAGNYTVMLRFTIDKEGNVSDVVAENNPGYGIAAEAIRVIENGPRWIPAEQNGKKVIYAARRTIVFQVN